MPFQQDAPSGGRELYCACHRGTRASDVCAGCGKFSCPRCKAAHPRLCPRCLQQRGQAGGLGLGDIFAKAWDAFCAYGLRLTLASAVTWLLPALLLAALLLAPLRAGAAPLETLSPPSLLAACGFCALALGFFFCGLLCMAQEALDGQAPSWLSLFQPKAGLKAAFVFISLASPVWVFLYSAGFFSQAVERWNGPLLAAGLVGWAALCLWLLPCIFLFQVFVEAPEASLLEAFGRCMRVGRGRRLRILLLMSAAGAVQQAASLCCLLYFPGFVFLILCQTALWRALNVER